MLNWLIPTHLALEGQFNFSCFNPDSQRAEYQSGAETTIRSNIFCTILLEERLACWSLPSEGRAGNGIIIGSLGRGSTEGLALPPSPRPAWLCPASPPPHGHACPHLHYANQSLLQASIHWRAGNSAFPSPKPGSWAALGNYLFWRNTLIWHS